MVLDPVKRTCGGVVSALVLLLLVSSSSQWLVTVTAASPASGLVVYGPSSAVSARAPSFSGSTFEEPAAEGTACFANGLDWVLYMNSGYQFGTANFSYVTSSNGVDWSSPVTFYAHPSSPIVYALSIAADCIGNQIYVVYAISSYVYPSGNSYSTAYFNRILYSQGTLSSTGTIIWSVSNETVASGYRLDPKKIIVDSNGNPWILALGVDWQILVWERVSGTWTPRLYTPTYDEGITTSIVPLQSGRVGLFYLQGGQLTVQVWNGTEWARLGGPSPTFGYNDLERDSVTSSGDTIYVAYSRNCAWSGVYFVSLSVDNSSWSAPRELVALNPPAGAEACVPDVAISSNSSSLIIFYSKLPVPSWDDEPFSATTAELDYCLSTNLGGNWSCDNRISYPEIQTGYFGLEVQMGTNPSADGGAFSLVWTTDLLISSNSSYPPFQQFSDSFRYARIAPPPNLTQLLQAFDNLSAQYRALSHEYSQLVSAYNQLSSNQQSLAASYASQTKAYALLASQLANLTQRYSSLSASQANLTSAFQSLSAQFSSQSKSYADLSSEYSALSQSFSGLSSSYQHLSDQLAQYQMFTYLLAAALVATALAAFWLVRKRR